MCPRLKKKIMQNPETLFKISYGVYIVSSIKAGKPNGQIANSVIQVTSEPATLAISINRSNLTHEYISSSGKFSVSILAKETPLEFISRFGFKSGREVDKFGALSWESGVSGMPLVLENAIGVIEAAVISKIDIGTHTIFIGKVMEAKKLSDAEPMTYAYYHEVKRGKSPKTAPTYQKEETKATINKENNMEKYVCKICGYVYDPVKADPDDGIAPGTAFEQIPDSWVCPVCGADKSQFEKMA